MRVTKFIKSTFVLIVILLGQNAYAQFQLLETKVEVDTLTFSERFAFHSNAIDWICEMPNADIEFDFGNTNWNNWSVLVGGKVSVPVWTKLNPYYVWDNKECHLEIRNYWRSHSSRLSAVYYWGLRGSYGNYDIKLGCKGNKGTFFFGGFSIGMVRQLYGYPSGNSVDLELGLTAGAVYGDNTKYHRGESGDYVNDQVTAKHLVTTPVVNEVRVGLIYRFGNFPISRKYRRRYDTDIQYHYAYDDYVARVRQQMIDQHNADSLFQMSYTYFAQQYDSIYKVKAAEEKVAKRVAQEEHRKEIQTIRAAKAEAKRKQTVAKQEQKHALREEKKAAKEARKAEKQAIKEAKKKAKQEAKAAKEAEKASKKAAKVAAASVKHDVETSNIKDKEAAE